MTHARLLVLALIGLVGIVPAAGFANPDPSPDPNAAVVLLRQDCGPAGSELENCFEDMSVLSDSTTGWIWTVRNPSAAAPLLVDVGPGEFSGFECANGGHVSVRGAGREISIVKDQFGANIVDCDQLVFLNLGVHGTQYGVNWIGAGFASWNDVDLVATAEFGNFASVAWNDACTTSEISLHYFHGSRARNTGLAPTLTSVFFSTCSETWWFGGELLLDVSGGHTNFAHNLQLSGAADFRAFGSAIRSRVTPTGTTGSLVGVNNAATFHSHGGIINTSVDPSVASTDATGLLSATKTTFSHTPGTAFVVNASGTGTAKRIDRNKGKVLSPFLWQSGNKPPQSTDENNVVLSHNGQDLFVETDCASSGDCAGAGDETHLMVYNDKLCPSTNPWFDTVTGACRQ